MPTSHFALIACQRSGTHLLCEIVNSNPHVALLGEPLSPAPETVRWPNYVRTLPAEKYPPAYATDAMVLLDEYMQAIERDVEVNAPWYGAPKPELKVVGIDVKYNQLKCISPLFSDLSARPILLDYFGSRKFHIVHLVRNPLHIALSIIIANHRSVWHSSGESHIEGRFHIPPVDLMNHLQWIKFEREEFVRLARGLPIYTIGYEDLVDDLNRVDQGSELPQDTRVLARLAELIDVPNQFSFTGQMRKVINQPYTEIIENHDELLEELKTSEFAELACSL
jgi:hypothetical protein